MMPLKPKIRKQNKTFKQVNVYNLVTKAKSFNDRLRAGRKRFS